MTEFLESSERISDVRSGVLAGAYVRDPLGRTLRRERRVGDQVLLGDRLLPGYELQDLPGMPVHDERLLCPVEHRHLHCRVAYVPWGQSHLHQASALHLLLHGGPLGHARHELLVAAYVASALHRRRDRGVPVVAWHPLLREHVAEHLLLGHRPGHEPAFGVEPVHEVVPVLRQHRDHTVVELLRVRVHDLAYADDVGPLHPVEPHHGVDGREGVRK